MRPADRLNRDEIHAACAWRPSALRRRMDELTPPACRVLLRDLRLDDDDVKIKRCALRARLAPLG